MTPLYGLQEDLLFLEPRLSSITQPIANNTSKKTVLTSDLFDKELFFPRIEKITQKLLEMQDTQANTSTNDLNKLQTEWSQFSEELIASLNENRPILESLKNRALVVSKLIASIHNQAYQQPAQAEIPLPLQESEPTAEELVLDATLLQEAASFDFAYPMTTHSAASLILKIVSNEYDKKFLKALTESHSAIFAQEAFVQLLLIDCIRSEIPLHSIEWFRDIPKQDLKALKNAIKRLTHQEITSLFFDDLSSQQSIKARLTKIVADCRIANFSFRTLLTILKPLFSLTENLTVQNALKEKDHDKALELIKTVDSSLVQSWCFGEIAERFVKNDAEIALKITRLIPDERRKTLRSVSIMQEISHAKGKEKAKEWLETIHHHARETFILSLVKFKIQKEEDAADDDALALLLMLPKPHPRKTDLAISSFAHSLAERDLEKAKVVASTIQNKKVLVDWFYEIASLELNNTDQTFVEIAVKYVNTLKLLYDAGICSYKPEEILSALLNKTFT